MEWARCTSLMDHFSLDSLLKGKRTDKVYIFYLMDRISKANWLIIKHNARMEHMFQKFSTM